MAAAEPTAISAQSQGLDEEEEDRLSKLHDDVLLCILDKLELLRDAVRTSVLSRRWRHLPGLLSEIDLRICRVCILDKLELEDDDKCTSAPHIRANVTVVEAAKSVLAHRSQHSIRLLRMTFFLRDESIDIFRSLDYALENNGREVVKADFMILPEKPHRHCTQHDTLAYGRRFMAFMGAYPRAFGALTSLWVQSLSLGESDIPNVLDTCKKLECLSLVHCAAMGSAVLRVEHPRLDELRIIRCYFETVELSWLPRLTRLTCANWMDSHDGYPLSFGYVPRLWALTLRMEASMFQKNFKLSEFLGNAAIGELELDFQGGRIWVQPQGPKLLAPPFRNLQLVTLQCIHGECDLTWTMFFLQVAPFLKKMNIVVWDHVCYKDEGDEEYDLSWQQFYPKGTNLKWETPDGFKHYKLSELTVSGFQAEIKFMRYIRCVMGAAVNLELITLLETRNCASCPSFHPSTIFPRTDEERDLTRKQISRLRSSPIQVKIGIWSYLCNNFRFL